MTTVTTQEILDELHYIEWEGRLLENDGSTTPCCPSCMGREMQGHEKRCSLDSIIQRLEELKDD